MPVQILTFAPYPMETKHITGTRSEWLMLILMTLLSVGLITFILPRDTQFKFEFQPDKPWPHEDLLAPFDYPIAKSTDIVEKEKEDIRKNAKPYFRFDSTITETELKKYDEEFEDQWPSSEVAKGSEGGFFSKLFNAQTPESSLEKEKKRHYEAGKAMLSDLYHTGILEHYEVLDDMGVEDVVVVIKDKEATETELGKLLMLQDAYDKMKASLTDTSLDVAFLSDVLEECLAANLIYDPDMTNNVIREQINDIPTTKGLVQMGQKIVGRGEVVDEEVNEKLQSLRQEYMRQLGPDETGWQIVAAQSLLVLLVLSIILIYVLLSLKDILKAMNSLGFLLAIIVMMLYMSVIPLYIPGLSYYLLPFCLLPIVLRTFFDLRIAVFVHLITMMLVAMMVPNSLEFIILESVAGIAGIYSLVRLRKRSQVLISSLVIFVSYCLVYLSFSLVRNGRMDDIEWINFAWFGGSAVLTLLSYPLLYAFEKIFGFLSDVTLMELCDTNSKLLRKLSELAPGTFQHSLQVANLAEAAVGAVGGRTMLIRAGALYHDLGKMLNPGYFIENQSGENPHTSLSYEESAKVIIAHVTDGIREARKAGLPDEVIDFIRTHHGTNLTWYFYHSHRKEHPDVEVDMERFRYPGPVPFSKETAILMMADSVEAASRSLSEYTTESIDQLVERIIKSQSDNGQFINADITFKEISQLKDIFKRMLHTIYHVRIAYPES